VEQFPHPTLRLVVLILFQAEAGSLGGFTVGDIKENADVWSW
jgi:hypothetical protein